MSFKITVLLKCSFCTVDLDLYMLFKQMGDFYCLLNRRFQCMNAHQVCKNLKFRRLYIPFQGSSLLFFEPPLCHMHTFFSSIFLSSGAEIQYCSLHPGCDHSCFLKPSLICFFLPILKGAGNGDTLP